MTERADSPWYPSMRLYRQEKRSSWTEPLARVRADLEKLAICTMSRTVPPSQPQY